MNTTNLFVELLIIGAGFLSLLSTSVIAAIGSSWKSPFQIDSSILLVALLGFSYVLGIVMDRFADQVFRSWDRKLRLRNFKDNESYHEARTYVYINANEKIISLFEYGRSRVRITRAWSIIFLLLGISIPAYFLRIGYVSTLRVNMLIFISFEILALLTLQSWRKLAINDYERLEETFNLMSKKR